MVWGAFSSLGKLELSFPSTRMDSREYQEVLSTCLVPYIRQFRRIPLTFQQDNARIHTSNDTKTWFAGNKIKFMEWPACSPDCNPMENLWGILVRKVYANNRQYETVEQLKVAINAAWQQIEVQVLQNLVQSMSNRIFEVINKNGNATNY